MVFGSQVSFWDGLFLDFCGVKSSASLTRMNNHTSLPDTCSETPSDLVAARDDLPAGQGAL